MQRFLDIVCSLLALVALAPVLIPVMVLLRLTGEGEVLFRQKRVGFQGKEFGLYKFATMLKASPNIGTGTLTVSDDPRVLPVGRFLRKTKINELPQILNILAGDMSIIGPRPQTRRCFDAFPPNSQAAITKVIPGLTGIGSIIFRDEEQMLRSVQNPARYYDQVIMPYKGKLEEWYVRRQGVLTYIALICLTAWVVVFPRSNVVWQVFPGLPTPPKSLMPRRDLQSSDHASQTGF